MKRHITYKTIIGLAVFLLFVAGGLQAQTHGSITPNHNKNYVRSTKVLVSEVYGDAELNTKTIGQIQQQIDYFDGLGRLQEQVTVAATPGKKDLVRPVVYDPLGREAVTYLPYERTGTTGSFTPITGSNNAITAQKAFYTTLHGATDGAYAYSQKVFENSPLDRVLQESSPGAAWQIGSKTARIVYTANTAGEVKRWNVVSNTLSQSSTYGVGELSVTQTTDPDGRIMREYKNKQGQVIETRQIAPNNGGTLITSYVYDNRGQLAKVIPPKAQALTANSAAFNQLVYTYIYDIKGRLIQKQLPGAEAEFYVYDSRDRLVMSQDGNQRLANKWRHFYYDYLNRPAADGLVACTTDTATLRRTYNATFITASQGAAVYTWPTVSGIPTLTANGVLGYTFYNDYAWVPTGGNNYAYTTADFPGYAYPQRMTTVKGQVTGSKIKVLDGNEETASAKWLITVTYYDNKYRPIQVKTDLYTGAANGMATVSTLYLFDGAIDRLREKQVFNTTTTTTDLRYVYDHARRPIQVYHKVNNQAETLITQTTYDALGRAKTKTQGTNVQTVNYAYNIRDWITQISSGTFTTNLYYNTLPSGVTAPTQFDSNIAAVTFKQGAGAQQSYGYTYDGFSRLTQGLHSGGFNEKGIAYDANGNITALTRQGGTNPGTFTYTYNGNKLTQLKIGSTAYNYVYDANGNTTTDGLRGFTITYNLLNLPKRVSKGADYLEYVYDAGGNKLAKKKNGNFAQFYMGDIVYKADKTPEYLTMPEGLALYVNNTFNYQYNQTDHLGNVRAVVDANSKSVVQTNDYYPYGLSHSVANLQKNKYLYNGKEYQDETLGGTLFGELDYGARFYDPVIGRFKVQDRFTEKYYSLSPYNYCAGNPISFVDVNGDSIWVTIDTYGEGGVLQSSGKYYYGETGKDINGKAKYGFIGSDGKAYKGDDIFVGQLTAALQKLQSKPTGNALVEYMMNNEKSVTMGWGLNQASSDGAMITWNPSQQINTADVNGKSNAINPFVMLGHEMQHTKNIWEDTANFTPWFTTVDQSGRKKTTYLDEISATHTENQIRAEHGLPLREFYQDYPDENTRLIKAGTSESRYYNGAGVTDYTPVTGGGFIYIPKIIRR